MRKGKEGQRGEIYRLIGSKKDELLDPKMESESSSEVAYL